MAHADIFRSVYGVGKQTHTKLTAIEMTIRLLKCYYTSAICEGINESTASPELLYTL